jgi:hypothetical protein
MPIQGTNIFIGDRNRESELRQEVMCQLNEHTEMLNKIKIQLMIDEEERIVKQNRESVVNERSNEDIS